jgi:hypothetical protein
MKRLHKNRKDAYRSRVNRFRQPVLICGSILAVVVALSAASSVTAMRQTRIRSATRKSSPSKTAVDQKPSTAKSASVVTEVEKTPNVPGVKTDYSVYPEPTPPALPPAGEKFVDPVFGTTILRVTDEKDGAFNANSYSYWPSLNRDSTRLFITCGGKATLYDFDGARFQIFANRPLFVVNPPVGHAVTAEDAIWSGSDPDVIFAHDGMRLWSYNVENKKYTLEKDFVRQFGIGHLHQMSRSVNDNVFAFTIKDKNFVKTGYAVWWRDKDIVYKVDAAADMDEVQIDKTGQYLVVKTGKAGKGQVRVQIVNLQTRAVESLVDADPDYAPGHSDNGSGFLIGGDNWRNRFNYRKLATPHRFYPVIEMGNDWSIGSHVSLLADDESWMLMSTFTANELPSTGVFRNELLLVATDGSKRVRRLAHIHSLYRDYWDSPRADISRDGRFAVFTSNWGNPGRRDVFILKIPPDRPTS